MTTPPEDGDAALHLPRSDAQASEAELRRARLQIAYARRARGAVATASRKLNLRQRELDARESELQQAKADVERLRRGIESDEEAREKSEGHLIRWRDRLRYREQSVREAEEELKRWSDELVAQSEACERKAADLKRARQAERRRRAEAKARTSDESDEGPGLPFEVCLVVAAARDTTLPLLVPLRRSLSIIGRTQECDLCIPMANVSRRHCRIDIVDDGVYVRDLDSRNGVYHNQERLEGSTRLMPGDTITIGPISFVVVINGEPNQIRVAEVHVEPASRLLDSEAAAESQSTAHQ